MVRFMKLAALAITAAVAAAAPSLISTRDVEYIPHDEVKGFDEKAPAVVTKFKPFLKVSSGCVPFPAVDKDGKIKYTPLSLGYDVVHHPRVNETNAANFVAPA